MSHIGKKPIEIPKEVKINIDGQTVTITGPKGELKREVRPEVEVVVKGDNILLSMKEKTKKAKAFWGTERALLANMIEGVTKGYEKKLRLEGVGYRADVDGNKLKLKVGFSHEVEFEAPEGIELKVQGKIISVSGIRKEKVGLVASKIKKIRRPNPYTGKGIRYEGEEIKLKLGNKAVAGD